MQIKSGRNAETTRRNAWARIMTDLRKKWSKRLDRQAKKEGWALFAADGVIQVQAIDEPEEGDGELLGGDAEAYQLCVFRALAGSKMHLLALYLDGRAYYEDEHVGQSESEIQVPKILLRK